MRAGDSMWNNDSIRGYHGWTLNERSSYTMAAAIPKKQRVQFKGLQPGDLMLYGSSQDPNSIYHVNTYIGGGWALDSGDDGVTILNVASGWHRDTFQFGRRLHPAKP
jgi:cell wall-associated NlpC family hydrolase